MATSSIETPVKMGGHVNLDAIFIAHLQSEGKQKGVLSLDYSNVKWEHKVFANNFRKRCSTNETEFIDKNSHMNEVEQYYK